jgi:hypothetical protein
VSEEEFVRQQSIRGAGIKQAYSCLDADSNGQITRQEMWEMKNQFWRSKLSKLSTSELIKWISNPKCVDTDMREYLAAFHSKQVAGLSMWTYGIQNPIMMKTRLGIQNDMKRAHISESVCREIMGQGCLQDGMWEGWTGGWGFWAHKVSLVVGHLQTIASGLYYCLIGVVPMYYGIRNLQTQYSMKDILEQATESAKSMGVAARASFKLRNSPRTKALSRENSKTQQGNVINAGSGRSQSRAPMSEADKAKRMTHPPSGLRRSKSQEARAFALAEDDEKGSLMAAGALPFPMLDSTSGRRSEEAINMQQGRAGTRPAAGALRRGQTDACIAAVFHKGGGSPELDSTRTAGRRFGSIRFASDGARERLARVGATEAIGSLMYFLCAPTARL